MKPRFFLCLMVTGLLFACKKDDADQTPVTLKTREVNSSLNYPWEILWGPDNFIWMTERQGRISRVNPQTGVITPLLTIPDIKTTTNYNGLLGMVLHPQFNTTPQVFVVYNYDSEGTYLEKVVRYTYNGTTLINPVIIVDSIKGRIGGEFIHNGSRLAISSDMKLFVATGDNNDSVATQDNASLNGKILRVNLDGSIPADNPMAGNRVWTVGHRNPQGLVFAGSKLYSSEHGQDDADEINLIEKGRNYGWRVVHGACDLPAELPFCSSHNVKEPEYEWTPTIAPSGIDYYNSDSIPQWKNSLLITNLKAKKLIQMKLNDIKNPVDFYANQFGRLRDVCISPDGKVYLCTDNGNNQDKIIEISRQ